MRQKPGEEFPPPGKTQAMGASFAGMTHGDDERNVKPGQNGEQEGGIGGEIIDANFEEIDIARPDFPSTFERPGSVHGSDDIRLSA